MKSIFKKFSLFTVILSMLFTIVGCTPYMHYYGPAPAPLEVKAIQLIEYDNPNVQTQEYVINFNAKHAFENFDESKCTVLEELDKENFLEFETDLSEGVGGGNALKRGPIGQGIRIIYSDESFFVSTWGEVEENSNCEGFVGDYNADGTPKENSCMGVDPMYYMIVAANYFETKISQ